MSDSVSIHGFDPYSGDDLQFDVTRTPELSFELQSGKKAQIPEDKLEQVLVAIETLTPGSPTIDEVNQFISIYQPMRRVMHYLDSSLAHQVFISAFQIGKAIGLFPPEMFDQSRVRMATRRLQGKLPWQGQRDCFLYCLGDYFFGNEPVIRHELIRRGLLFTAFLGDEVRDFVPYYPADDQVTDLTEQARLVWQEITTRRSA